MFKNAHNKKRNEGFKKSGAYSFFRINNKIHQIKISR